MYILSYIKQKLLGLTLTTTFKMDKIILPVSIVDFVVMVCTGYTITWILEVIMSGAYNLTENMKKETIFFFVNSKSSFPE